MEAPIPDARLYAPAGDCNCDCLAKTEAARYREQYMCEHCEPLIVKIERAALAAERRDDETP